MSGFILPLAEGQSRPARSAAAGGQFGDFLCKAGRSRFLARFVEILKRDNLASVSSYRPPKAVADLHYGPDIHPSTAPAGRRRRPSPAPCILASELRRHCGGHCKVRPAYLPASPSVVSSADGRNSAF